MSNIVIGVGGTGAKCVEAFIHLCAMGFGPDELYVLIVDPDRSNGNVDRTRQTIQSYQKCHDHLRAGMSLGDRGGMTFGTKLRYGKANDADSLLWSQSSGQDAPNNLGELFGFPFKDENLCRIFYSQQELKELNWGVGFRGRASVANPAMALIEQALATEPWKSLLSVTKNTLAVKEQKTFIFASCFGATGAGGFPVIPQILRDCGIREKWEGRDRFGIGSALLLPYMFFEAPSDFREIHAKSQHFLMNSQAAMLHYGRAWNEGSPYDAVYYAGAKTQDRIDLPELGGNFKEGGEKQKNPSHYVELLAAMAAVDFFTRTQEYEKVGERRRKCHYYAIGGEKSESVGWPDVPEMPNRKERPPVTNVKRSLARYVSTLAAFRDFYLPLLRDDEFEGKRKLAAWYYESFPDSTLTNAEAKEPLKALNDWCESIAFPWLWQWHATSQARPVHLLNRAFLDLHNRSEASQVIERRASFTNVLDDHAALARSRNLDDGYTFVWDAFCNGRPHVNSRPIPRFWDMLVDSVGAYVDRRYFQERIAK